ncbi:hypothetical protein SVIOM342S_06873 [Streptomyces violaceorubidus]
MKLTPVEPASGTAVYPGGGSSGGGAPALASYGGGGSLYGGGGSFGPGRDDDGVCSRVRLSITVAAVWEARAAVVRPARWERRKNRWTGGASADAAPDGARASGVVPVGGVGAAAWVATGSVGRAADGRGSVSGAAGSGAPVVAPGDTGLRRGTALAGARWTTEGVGPPPPGGGGGVRCGVAGGVAVAAKGGAAEVVRAAKGGAAGVAGAMVVVVKGGAAGVARRPPWS